MVYDLLIIAAGDGTRLKNYSTRPKALMMINGECNLANTIGKVTDKQLFRNIYVVSNKKNFGVFDEELENIKTSLDSDPNILSKTSIYHIGIESGRGDGHAVMMGMKTIEEVLGDDALSEKFFVMWGDAYLDNTDVFEDCIKYDAQYDITPMLVPVVMEKDPYVSFLVDEKMNCISVDFSKRGEHHPSGYHDQSIFLCCKTCLNNSLEFIEAAYNKNGRYITDSGENTFLYVIHYFFNIDFPVKALVTEPSTRGFNNIEDILAINSTFA